MCFANATVREAAELLQRSADAKHIDRRVEIDAVLSTFYGDPLRLQQVVSNLVSNAIKFRPVPSRPAGVRVNVD